MSAKKTKATEKIVVFILRIHFAVACGITKRPASHHTHTHQWETSTTSCILLVAKMLHLNVYSFLFILFHLHHTRMTAVTHSCTESLLKHFFCFFLFLCRSSLLIRFFFAAFLVLCNLLILSELWLEAVLLLPLGYDKTLCEVC